MTEGIRLSDYLEHCDVIEQPGGGFIIDEPEDMEPATEIRTDFTRTHDQQTITAKAD